MAQTTISVAIDSKDKSRFDSFCNDVGLSTTSAINLFVKAVIREHRIPFEIYSVPDDPFYNPVNQRYVLKSVEEIKSGKGQIYELIEEDNK